jgi:prepilin-type N-terminal cleavage/methylation domain-containing protein
MHTSRKGFTIVELLIVIVVIGILAAITIVAYNGIQNRARASSVSSALSQAAKKLAVYQVDNPDAYPADKAALDALGVKDTGDVTYEYTRMSGTPNTYCLTATNGTTSYKISNASTTPTAGGCAGHSQGGVAAITNIVPNPKGTSSTSTGWFRPLVGTDMTTASNVTFNSRSDWNRIAYNGTGNSTARLRLPLTSLTNGTSYTTSVLLGNNNASATTVTFDFCDQGSSSITLQPGEVKRHTFTASRATYDATYSFVDISFGAVATGILATEAMVTTGTNTYNYADGDTTNWIWNGTANNATSTGPAV